jgi:hypothetical protein
MARQTPEGTELGAVLRLTWMTDQLAHIPEHARTDEPLEHGPDWHVRITHFSWVAM